jgi:hypothetical protein
VARSRAGCADIRQRETIRKFEREGTLEEIKNDTVDEVLEGGDWTDDDRHYLETIEQLLRDGILQDGSDWYCGPYPPTSRSLNVGKSWGRGFASAKMSSTSRPKT